MADIFVDANRGNDANSGATKFLALRTPPQNPNPGAGNGIYYASDSVFDLTPTKTAQNYIGFFRNGASATSRITFGAYDYAGVTGTKPTFRTRMIPSSSDWTWDAGLSAWYIAFSYAIGTNQRIVVQGALAVTCNGGGGGVNINSIANQMALSTLRFFVNTGTNRLYLAGGGLTSLANPSVFFGAGNIQIGHMPAFFLYEAGSYCVFDGLQVQDGGGLLQQQSNAADIQLPGFEIKNITARNTEAVVDLIHNNSGAARCEISFHDSQITGIASYGFHTYGHGVVGQVYNVTFSDGNQCSAQGGAVYTQSDTASTGEKLIIRDCTADRIANGTGNCTFDGSGFYADVGDVGTVFTRLTATNCFKGYQLNSGKAASVIACRAINCDQFITATDADSRNTSDYLIANNLHVTTAGCNQFYRGTTAALSNGQTPSINAYADGGDLVAAKIYNNALVPTGDCSGLTPIMAYSLANAAKVDVKNNYGTGWNAKFVMNTAFTDITAGKSSITTGVPGFYNSAAGDYRLATTSQLIGAGFSGLAANTEDFRRRQYNTPPSIGPYEKDPFVSLAGVLISK